MIQQKGKNKYNLIVSVTIDGKRTRKSKTVTCQGKREAQRLYNDFEREVLNSKTPAGYTVAQLLTDYVASLKIMGVKETTLRGYNNAINRIIPVLGDETASKVNPYALQNFVVQMANKYAVKTIKNTMGLLSAAYNRAVKLGELNYNPCNAVTLPKNEQREIKTLSAEEIGVFVDMLDYEQLDFKAAVMLALFCGLRRSEICGLTAEDINLNFGYVTIRQSRHVIDGKEIIQTPKTARSRRTLALPSFVCDVLGDLLDAHAMQDYETSAFLIQDGFGKPINPQTLCTQLARYEKKNGLPSVSLHGLRHTYATMLIHSGAVDIAQVSAELGHSNVTTTLNIYTHAMGGASMSSKAVANAAESIFNETRAHDKAHKKINR